MFTITSTITKRVQGSDAFQHLQRPRQPFSRLQPQRMSSLHILDTSGMVVHSISYWFSSIFQPHLHGSGKDGFLHSDCDQQYEAW
jgi:hypothetical protein